ncbi:MAG: hypothetical protein E7554_03715 [Ruminococcaceae bacterium]|nr:hypothetical protein [Oscillospiraceae bacterium]
MDNIIETIKEKIEEIVAKIKGDDGNMSKFKSNPLDTVKDLLGKIDLPDGALENIVEGVKDKLGIGKDDAAETAAEAAADDGDDSIVEKIGDAVGGLFEKAKDLFSKKDD